MTDVHRSVNISCDQPIHCKMGRSHGPETARGIGTHAQPFIHRDKLCYGEKKIGYRHN